MELCRKTTAVYRVETQLQYTWREVKGGKGAALWESGYISQRHISRVLTGERENGGRSFLSRMDRYTTFGVVGIWDSWLNRQVTCVNSSGVVTEMAVAYPLFYWKQCVYWNHRWWSSQLSFFIVTKRSVNMKRRACFDSDVEGFDPWSMFSPTLGLVDGCGTKKEVSPGQAGERKRKRRELWSLQPPLKTYSHPTRLTFEGYITSSSGHTGGHSRFHIIANEKKKKRNLAFILLVNYVLYKLKIWHTRCLLFLFISGCLTGTILWSLN